MPNQIRYIAAAALQKLLQKLEEEILADASWLGERDRAILRSLQVIQSVRESMDEIAEEPSNRELERWLAGELTLDELERQYILATLERVGGSKTAASEALGLPRRSLYRRLAEYGMV